MQRPPKLAVQCDTCTIIMVLQLLTYYAAAVTSDIHHNHIFHLLVEADADLNVTSDQQAGVITEIRPAP